MHAEFEVFRSCYHHIGGDATDGGKHGGADGGGIMAEDAYKLLNFFALDESDGGGGLGRDGGIGCHLLLFAVLRGGGGVHEWGNAVGERVFCDRIGGGP